MTGPPSLHLVGFWALGSPSPYLSAPAFLLAWAAASRLVVPAGHVWEVKVGRLLSVPASPCCHAGWGLEEEQRPMSILHEACEGCFPDLALIMPPGLAPQRVSKTGASSWPCQHGLDLGAVPCPWSGREEIRWDLAGPVASRSRGGGGLWGTHWDMCPCPPALHPGPGDPGLHAVTCAGREQACATTFSAHDGTPVLPASCHCLWLSSGTFAGPILSEAVRTSSSLGQKQQV